jgi:hypothetical protein
LGYLREITKERVRQILTAGSKGQEVLDGGPNGHSVFTGRLIEVLEATGDFITANEIQAILKEKVYGDAKGRGHTQTPGFGALSGSGDFVFVPSKEYLLEERRAEQGRIQKDIDKSRKEQEKIQREMAEMESLEQKAKQASNDRERRKAEDARIKAEAKLTLERFNQQKLEEEKRRKSLDEAELVKLEQERQKQLESARQLEARLRQDDEQRANDLQRLEREQLTTRQQEEQKVALLRTEAEERRKKTLVVAGSLSLDAAVAEIKNTSARIDEINKEFADELAQQKAAADQRRQGKLALLKQNHDKQMATLRQQVSTFQSVQKTVVSPKDEFESEAKYRDRAAKTEKADHDRTAITEVARNKVLDKEQTAYERLVNQVETTYREDIRTQEQRIDEVREAALKPLKERMAVLAKQEITLGSESLELSVGQYDAEKEMFIITITNKPNILANVVVNGCYPIPREQAKEFKQHYNARLIRPEVKMFPGNSAIMRVSIIDDNSPDYFGIYENGEFLTIGEKKRRALVVATAEQERSTYIDTTTGLMWLKIGKVLSEKRQWKEAKAFVSQLNIVGFSDWRLPTRDELEKMVKTSDYKDLVANYYNRLNIGLDYYWTSTKFGLGLIIQSVRVINMKSGDVAEHNEDRLHYVIPVRNINK